MARITIKNTPVRSFEARAGLSLLEALQRFGIEVPSPCGGKGICGKCKVRVERLQGQADFPQGALSEKDYRSGLRLACRGILGGHGELAITLPGDYCLDSRVLAGERLALAALDPAVGLTAGENGYRMTYQGDSDTRTLEDWPAGQSPKGAAVDLGTTTIVVTVMDLQTGLELGTASTINPQIRFGHDIISRIAEAAGVDGLRRLRQAVSACLDGLIRQACGAAKVAAGLILDVVIGGNAAMLQILAGIDPAPLGRLPFQVDLESGRAYPAGRFNLKSVHTAARVYIPPIPHAFIGADISAGLLAADFFENTAGPCLFVDMGTNTEMVLNTGERQVATATAAGPVFEGMGISCGTRAVAGAIDSVQAIGNHLTIRTIDDAEPVGICGSALLDAAACLLKEGILDHTGRLTASDPKTGPISSLARRVKRLGGQTVFELAETIFLTQKDIRRLQLAKSAVQSGLQAMLAAVGMPPEALRKIIVAGAFGFYLRKDSLKILGLVPETFDGDLVFAGNACRLGCALMLVNGKHRNRIERRMGAVTHLQLAGNTDFQRLFIKNMWFGRARASQTMSSEPVASW